MRVYISSALAFTVVLPGCSALVRESVETQPRVTLQADAFLNPSEIVHGDAVAYEPSFAASDAAAFGPDVLRHAPIIVQGVQPASGTSRYDRSDDDLGAPRLSAGDEVRIDTSLPVIFARVEQAVVGGVALEQLVYAFWYPAHPEGSIEKGKIDGGVLRITLGIDGNPAVFECTQPCGCFHGVFVSSALEEAAADEWRSVAPNRLHAIEPPLTGEDDWVVRDLVRVIPGGRPVLYMSAGKHFCEAISFVANDQRVEGASELVAYSLAPYEMLDRVPRDGGGEGSIFDERGLVRGAKRWQEEIVLADLDNPGWPRHLDRMLIHWDQARWSDPSLLERHLRLPASLTSAIGAAVARDEIVVSAPGERASRVASDLTGVGAVAMHGRELLLFTNRYCTGCTQVKERVLPSPLVRRAAESWETVIVDTATPEGARLAAQWHISMVPVLVGVEDGRELFRSEDIDTPEKVAHLIG